MMAQTQSIRPQDLLCAIFLSTQEAGPINRRDLRARFGLGEEALEKLLKPLRQRGLLQDEGFGLTFVGLATAVQLLPECRWTGLEQNETAAA